MLTLVFVAVAICAVTTSVFLYWFTKNYSSLMLEQNENACSIAKKILQTKTVHPDSEYGVMLKRLNELMATSLEKRTELLKSSSLRDKKNINMLAEELSKVTGEMIEIMKEVEFSDPIWDKSLTKKLAVNKR